MKALLSAYTIKFKGRKIGAIGKIYHITDYRIATTPEKAIKALYDEYEHIFNAVTSLKP